VEVVKVMEFGRGCCEKMEMVRDKINCGWEIKLIIVATV
jgi:hypothetical protein